MNFQERSVKPVGITFELNSVIELFLVKACSSVRLYSFNCLLLLVSALGSSSAFFADHSENLIKLFFLEVQYAVSCKQEVGLENVR